LAARSESLTQSEADLVARSEALDAARVAFRAEQELRSAETATRPNVVELLRERGIRGVDEAQRAIGALAFGHVLGPLVKHLAVLDEAGFRQVLADKLVLVGGEVPDGLSVPGVSVSPDRADLPGADVLGRAVGKLAEQWLLFGFRTVTLAGVPPRWHGLLRSLVDKRVTIHFVPPPSGPPEALGPSEAWFAWGPPPTDAAVDRAFWVPADGNLVSWILRATAALAGAP